MRLFFSLLLLLPGLLSQAQLLHIDQSRSKVTFSIRNMGAMVGGQLEQLEGKINLVRKPITSTSFDVVAKVSTINTDNPKRDNHLKAADFFDAVKFPDIRIVSKALSKTEDGKALIFDGSLTIKDVTRPLTFPFTVMRSPEGYRFSGSFKVNRSDFGVGAASMLMSDEVEVSINVLALEN